MAVLLETSAGNLVVDLYAEKCPTACLNFVKLCKMHYYDGHLFFDVQRNYWMRTGDPTGTGKGGQSVFSLLENKDADDTKAHSKYFADEIVRGAKFDRRGLVCMASTMKDQNGSSFLITMTDHGLEHLNGTRSIFGEIGEGLGSTLAAINELQVDDKYRPLRDVRILCTHVLDDPFPDPPGLPRPLSLPAGARPPQESVEPRIGFDENLDEDFGVSTEELEKRSKARDAKARAVILEMVGDLPDADMKPPENVLFVCKLNAATQEDDLELIFSRFGEVKSCEIIRDKETGDSLQYAFIEFGNEEQCQEAFFKMNNVMIDDRRIKVDFSQSVSKLWNDARRGTRRRLPPSFSTGRDERSRYHERVGPRSHQNQNHHRHIRDAEHHVHLSREGDRRSHPRENRNAGELSREGRHSNKRTARESNESESESGSDSGSSISSRDRKRRRKDDRGRHKHRKKHKSRSGEKKKKSRKHESGKKHKKHKKHKSSRRD